jgi:hypothetical protein
VHLDLVVAVLRAAVEAKCVLKAGAAAALDGDAKNLEVLLRVLGEELLDLARGRLGERHHRVGFYQPVPGARMRSL